MNDLLRLPLERQLVSILAASREDSFGTQRKRSHVLMQAAGIVVDTFGLQKWTNLKLKHVQHLVDVWKAADTGRRTIEYKLSHLRWLLAKLGKNPLLPRNNRDVGVQPGPRHTRAGKGVSDKRLAEILTGVVDPRVRAAILLARQLGMRFEEASLFRPHEDVQGRQVWVKRGSKGGRPRYLVVWNPRQQEAIEAARSLAPPEHGLIPPQFESYEQWRQHVYPQLRAAGIARKTDTLFHDLRRAYAIERMRHLVKERGYPVERASKVVALELGHRRIDVLSWYLAAESLEEPGAATGEGAAVA